MRQYPVLEMAGYGGGYCVSIILTSYAGLTVQQVTEPLTLSSGIVFLPPSLSRHPSSQGLGALESVDEQMEFVMVLSSWLQGTF